MKAGAATTTINNELGSQIQGAGLRDQRVESIRDDLEANALSVHDGNTELLFISCDLVGLSTEIFRHFARAIAEVSGIDSHCILSCRPDSSHALRLVEITQQRITVSIKAYLHEAFKHTFTPHPRSRSRNLL